jgi:hypothetical protein
MTILQHFNIYKNYLVFYTMYDVEKRGSWMGEDDLEKQSMLIIKYSGA